VSTPVQLGDTIRYMQQEWRIVRIIHSQSLHTNYTLTEDYYELRNAKGQVEFYTIDEAITPHQADLNALPDIIRRREDG